VNAAAVAAGEDRRLEMRAILRRLRKDDGTTTAEYAVVTAVACAFAMLLYRVVTGGSVVSALGRIISSALAVHL
jgi:Flp pilus assembly pilin Flp